MLTLLSRPKYNYKFIVEGWGALLPPSSMAITLFAIQYYNCTYTSYFSKAILMKLVDGELVSGRT